MEHSPIRESVSSRENDENDAAATQQVQVHSPPSTPPPHPTPPPHLRKRAHAGTNTNPTTPTRTSEIELPTLSENHSVTTTPTASPSTRQYGDAAAWNSFQEGWRNDVLPTLRNDVLPTLDERIGRPSRKAMHSFFYTNKGSLQPQPSTTARDSPTRMDHGVAPPNNNNDDDALAAPPQEYDEQDGIQRTPSLDYHATQEEEDKKWMAKFWKGYDDWILLSLFGFLGILFRLAAANWFAYFDDVFNASSALFTNLPLNCLSCFLLGMLGSGNDLFEIIAARKRPGQNEEHVGIGEAEREPLCSSTQQQQQDQFNHGGSFSLDAASPALRQGHGLQHEPDDRQRSYSWVTPGKSAEDELREVQLQALERRIRASPCLVLFPVNKEEMDVMEHYVNDGRFLGEERRRQAEPVQSSLYDLSFSIEEEGDEEEGDEETETPRSQVESTPHVVVQVEDLQRKPSNDEGSLEVIAVDDPAALDNDDNEEETRAKKRESSLDMRHATQRRSPSRVVTLNGHTPLASAVATSIPSENDEYVVEGQGLDQFIHGVSANIQGVSTNITTNMARLNRVNLADGWDDGTSARTMSDDLLLGLRTGFCGALSSFTSWNSSMVNLLRGGNFGEAFVGYIIGLQLPIVAYRFGQHVALYLFVWRCRRETKRDERRGYGLRLRQDDDDDDIDSDLDNDLEEEVLDEDGNVSPTAVVRRGSPNKPTSPNGLPGEEYTERETLSIRAVATVLFVLAIVLQVISINVWTNPQQQQTAISLLFSPFGVLARWRLSKWNSWRPNFPVGTFAANMLACALSGSLGSLLAGNPGPEESIVLVAMISGFGGSLSSMAQLVVEILAGIDPIIFKYDGIIYAIATIWWGFVIGLVTRASKDWADEI